MSREYIENFNKKYYLFFTYENKTYIVYEGSLKSILKYTMYKDFRYTSIYDESSLKTILIKNIKKEFKAFSGSENINKGSFFISSSKDGKNKIDLLYCNMMDVLYTEANDIKHYINNLRINKDDFNNPSKEKIEFAKFICELIDEDYKEKLKEERLSHDRTTNLDVLRKKVSSSINYSNYRKNNNDDLFFEKFILFDDDVFLTALEYICKDFSKKTKLINKIKNIKPGYILTMLGTKDDINKEYKKRSWNLHVYLKNNCESRKYIEKSIYDSFIKNKIIESKIIEEKDVKENSPEEKNINIEYQEYVDAHKKEEPKEESTYVEYLIQEGISNVLKNDNGDILFDQEYDLDDMKK